MNKYYHELLIRSLDVELPAREKAKLQTALVASADLRQEKDRLQHLRVSLRQTTTESFADGFTDRVMALIPFQSRNEFALQLLRFFRPIAVAAMLIVFIVISINMINDDQVSLGNVFGVTEVSPEEAFNPLVDLIRE